MLGELSTKEAFDLIDQMAECGVLRVDITGGEPLVRKDIWQLIDRILSHHMVIRNFHTNGWLLDDEVLDGFEQRGLHPLIAISFDGVGWHDWMRGRKGAEEDALRAMRLCHSRGYQVSVGMCIHRGNVSSLPATVEALRAAGHRIHQDRPRRPDRPVEQAQRRQRDDPGRIYPSDAPLYRVVL